MRARVATGLLLVAAAAASHQPVGAQTAPLQAAAHDCIYTKAWLPKNNPGVLVPLYHRGDLIGYDNKTDTCTDSYFLAVARGCQAVVAVLNPYNGPLLDGSPHLPALRACAMELGRRGVRMVGYVHTKDTGKDPVTGVWKPTHMREQWLVTLDMDRWLLQLRGVPHFEGFFLDDTTNYYETVTNWQGYNHVWWYQQLINYAKVQLHATTVVLNPGSFVHLDLLTKQPAMPAPADISIPFETYASRWRPPGDNCATVQQSSQFGNFGPGPWCANMPKADQIEPFIQAVNNRTITVAAVVHTASKEFALREAKTAWNANFRYFYATDRKLEPPNDPWDGVPSFWDDYLRYLEDGEAAVPSNTTYGGGGVSTIPSAAPTATATALLPLVLLATMCHWL